MTAPLERYQILEEIGQGGFAIVYRALDTELKRHVALKALRQTMLTDREGVERFKREARTVARLDHQRVVTIHDIIELDNQLFIVMRLVEGSSLDKVIARQGRLPWTESLAILTALAEGLDAAHAQGILHRDLKPANILIDNERGPLLTDFGLATLADEAGPSFSAAGGVVGTPHYIAPEVWDGQDSSAQSDIYALGCILYEMLTASKAMEGLTPPAILMSHFKPLTLPNQWPDGVPPGVTQVLQVALAKAPADRYGSAGEMAAALTRLSGSVERSRSLPPERQAAQPEPDLPAFVAREPELNQLNRFLARTLAGRGSLVFVTGEAGVGKTTLVTEFTRRAQAAQPDLLVTLGSCNDLTGRGDPFLPFREVLSMLTGNVEAGLAKGASTTENVHRLKSFLNVSGEALVNLGPALIGTLIPGSALLVNAGLFAAKKLGWLDKVKQLTVGQDEAPQAPPPIEPEQIFEQYAAVLKAVAAQQPLIIWLDDLHWVDSSSASLLFYLARSLEASPVLIVGTYRPEDIAVDQRPAGPGSGLSADLQQHPLLNVINEGKRYWGDIQIDLGQTIETGGRQFIDALLDTEPNRLDEAFRQAFFQHTGGHPLFTIELLRDLQERQVLFKDAAGRWMIQSALDWNALPARVEGVIEKRVGRLDADLQEVLTVAGVEGVQFTAEVVAHIRALEGRTLVRRLSGELDKQHRLVQASGLQQVGRQRLSRYQFRHNLIQTYLYNRLDEMEQAYLHEDVAKTLEMLYGPEANTIAVQLAVHFEKAGLAEEAVGYLVSAGDAADRLYAETEAVAFYDKALALGGRSYLSADKLTNLYLKRGRALEHLGFHDKALESYQALNAAAVERQDQPMLLAAWVAIGTIRSNPTPVFDPAEAEAVAKQGLTLAQELDDLAAQAKINWNLMQMLVYRNQASDIERALAYGETALALSRRLGLQDQVAMTLNDLQPIYIALGFKKE